MDGEVVHRWTSPVGQPNPGERVGRVDLLEIRLWQPSEVVDHIASVEEHPGVRRNHRPEPGRRPVGAAERIRGQRRAGWEKRVPNEVHRRREKANQDRPDEPAGPCALQELAVSDPEQDGDERGVGKEIQADPPEIP